MASAPDAWFKKTSTSCLAEVLYMNETLSFVYRRTSFANNSGADVLLWG